VVTCFVWVSLGWRVRQGGSDAELIRCEAAEFATKTAVIDASSAELGRDDCIAVSCDSAEFDARTAEIDGLPAECVSRSAETASKTAELMKQEKGVRRQEAGVRRGKAGRACSVPGMGLFPLSQSRKAPPIGEAFAGSDLQDLWGNSFYYPLLSEYQIQTKNAPNIFGWFGV
jgi:hypothetical protein